MKSENEIRQAIEDIEAKDARCPVLTHKEGRPCTDARHAINGTYITVLRWVLGEGGKIW